MGAAIVGATVNLSLATDGVTVAGNAQLLVSPSFRQTTARVALSNAVAHVPPGPQHDFLVQTATAQVQGLLTQVFDAVRLSLADAIHRGLEVDLAFALAAIVAAYLLREMPVPPVGGEPDAGGDKVAGGER